MGMVKAEGEQVYMDEVKKKQTKGDVANITKEDTLGTMRACLSTLLKRFQNFQLATTSYSPLSLLYHIKHTHSQQLFVFTHSLSLPPTSNLFFGDHENEKLDASKTGIYLMSLI